jgi:hypothetical protein
MTTPNKSTNNRHNYQNHLLLYHPLPSERCPPKTPVAQPDPEGRTNRKKLMKSMASTRRSTSGSWKCCKTSRPRDSNSSPTTAPPEQRKTHIGGWLQHTHQVKHLLFQSGNKKTIELQLQMRMQAYGTHKSECKVLDDPLISSDLLSL